jgi:hypothetical protein
MAGRILKDTITTSISAATGGVITVTSTVGFYRNAIAYLANTGQPGITVKINRIISSTQMNVVQFTESRGGGVASASGTGGATQLSAVPQTNYGNTTPTAYIGGSITQPAHQIIYNPDDAPLT